MNYDALPKKRMAAGALIRNPNHYILIVKPTYRDGWLIPGGIIEENESPRAACKREIKEELGLEINLKRLLCIDYTVADEKQTESLQFIFDGGILPNETPVHLELKELSRYQFVEPEQALELFNSRLSRRVKAVLEIIHTNQTLYLEDQIAI